jgi:hypothetical protein
MLAPRIVLDFVTAESFRPFRIRMAHGPSFDVRYPETIRVGRTSVSVHGAIDTDQNEKWHDASLLLMETIEPLDAPVPQTNG